MPIDNRKNYSEGKIMKEQFRKMFNQLTRAELMAQELAEAERELLVAQTAVDYTNAMVAYQKARIDRLKSLLAATSLQ